MPCAGGSGSFSGAPGGTRRLPSDRAERARARRPSRAADESPEQWRYSPASFETARDRHRLALRADVDAAAGLDERRDVGVELLPEGEPVAVGRDGELLREVGEVVLVLLRAVEPDRVRGPACRRDLVAAALGLDEEDAVATPCRTAAIRAVSSISVGLPPARRPRPSRCRARRTTRASAGIRPCPCGRRSSSRRARRRAPRSGPACRSRRARRRRRARDADRPERLVVPGRVDDATGRRATRTGRTPSGRSASSGGAARRSGGP